MGVICTNLANKLGHHQRPSFRQTSKKLASFSALLAQDSMKQIRDAAHVGGSWGNGVSVNRLQLVGGDWNMAFMTFHILGTIIAFDFHIFQRGWDHQPGNSWPDLGAIAIRRGGFSWNPRHSCCSCRSLHRFLCLWTWYGLDWIDR